MCLLKCLGALCWYRKHTRRYVWCDRQIRRRLIIADTLHGCRGNSEYRNRHVPQASADTCAGIIWVWQRVEQDSQCRYKRNIEARPWNLSCQWRTGLGGGGVQPPPPPPEITKAPQNRAKLNPIKKKKKIAEFRTPTPQDVRKKGSKILKQTAGSQLVYISNDK